MNWYHKFKFAQQMGLYGQDPEQDPPLNIPQRTLFDVNSIPDTLIGLYSGSGIEEDLEKARNCQDVEYLLDQYRVNYDVVKWPGGATPVFVFSNGNSYVVECDNSGVSVSEASQWVYDISDLSLDSYIPMPDFSEDFWNSVTEKSRVYHATPSENIESILATGLNATSETRGLSNRFMGDSVFTSTNPEAISSYGDAIIEINVWAMAQSGYMPTVSGEDPLSEDQQRESIAHKLGLEDFHSEDRGWEGLDPDTVVFSQGIPPQFLRLLS